MPRVLTDMGQLGDWRLDHHCPTCGARPGQPCRPASLTQCHLARGSFEDEQRPPAAEEARR